jgi:outer membrane biosynthesis protein TonB
MPSLLRLCFTAGALSLALVVAGCEDFDPTAIFDSDIFNTKKKLPGDRRPVFPEGTPGVSQGVPPELMKGYQQPAQAEPKEAAKQASAAPAEAKSTAEAKPKPKPKPKKVAKPAETPPPAPAQSSQEASQQPQSPSPPAARQAPAASAWPASPQPSGGVAWPDPPPAR